MKMKRATLLLLMVFTLFGCKGESVKKEAGNGHISSLSPLKEDFADKFMMGNVFDPVDVSSSGVTNTALIRHYNVLTAGNNMKPDHLSTGKGSYNFTIADRMVNAAIASGFKVVGHTLLWHSQIPAWQKNMANANRETALEAMKQYITDVVKHFEGRIYSWDVINEAFPDSGYSTGSDWKNVMRQENPWYKAIGSDFVYESFLAARSADPGAILYYNDYNTDQAGRAAMIRNMVRDVNERYQAAYPDETRLLIEGIGMQEHHNTSVSASAIRSALNLFKPLGVKISVSELDVLIVNFQDFETYGQGPYKQNSITGEKRIYGLMRQAELYGQYFQVYLEFSDIIERVSCWGVNDDKSWRSAGAPLLFDAAGMAKDAYYSVIGTIK
ncbi:MAG: endo-1,4-beta-xylanase [Treponema sp.]|nr:endo-1,4-beta-xylanase [Treponema sp.]